MAKGNLFLGTAAKSVGDVVMYRREGSQVSRVRVRKIANPKTDAQCAQRAIMNAVVKFYQPLANILARSWQGMSRSKSYAKFLKTNASLGRTNGYMLAKGAAGVCFPYKLSSGTLVPVRYWVGSSKEHLVIDLHASASASASTIGGLSQIFVDAGYEPGDIVTIIIFRTLTDFITIQFKVDKTDTTPVSDWKSIEAITINTEDSGIVEILPMGGTTIGGAVIIAREKDGDWLRSTQSLVVDATTLASITNNEYKAAAIASFSNTVGDASPMVYLDGDELQ